MITIPAGSWWGCTLWSKSTKCISSPLCVECNQPRTSWANRLEALWDCFTGSCASFYCDHYSLMCGFVRWRCISITLRLLGSHSVQIKWIIGRNRSQRKCSVFFYCKKRNNSPCMVWTRSSSQVWSQSQNPDVLWAAMAQPYTSTTRLLSQLFSQSLEPARCNLTQSPRLLVKKSKYIYIDIIFRQLCPIKGCLSLWRHNELLQRLAAFQDLWDVHYIALICGEW